MIHLKLNAKRTKRRKEYLSEDVNGFMEYLKQNSQVLHNGQLIAADSQEVREEIAVALKKDSRREGRRLKRQAAKKNAMVRSWLYVATFFVQLESVTHLVTQYMFKQSPIAAVLVPLLKACAFLLYTHTHTQYTG